MTFDALSPAEIARDEMLAAGYGIPVIPPPEDGPAWPTLDPVALRGLPGKAVEAIGPHSEADPAGLLITFLAFFGSAVGASPHAVADGCQHPARLNVVLVGDSSRARKGTTAARVRSVFEHADPDWAADRVLSGFGSGEALVDEVRDPTTGVDKNGASTIIDEGVTDKRVMVLEGELARILAVTSREHSTLSSILRDAWDGNRLAARARQRRSVATGAHVSFVAAITVEELRRRLSETEMANGLANRFLFCCVRRSKLIPTGGNLPDSVVASLGNDCRHALVAARRIGTLRRSPAAEARWAEMYGEMALGPSGLLGAITARAEAQTLRLAVAYALLDQTATIDICHLEAAYAVWRYCETSARHIFGDKLGDEVADRLLAALRTAGRDGLDRSAQQELFSRHVTAARLALAAAELVRLGLAVEESQPTGGRPRIVLRLCEESGSSDKSPRIPPDIDLSSLEPLTSQNHHKNGAQT